MLATTSLPPLLDGPKRGHLHITIDSSQCLTMKPISAALSWWGCQPSPSDTVWFSSTAQASIIFALRSRAPYIFKYLHDAKHLQITIFDADGLSLGQAIVKLHSITPDKLQLAQLVDISTPHLTGDSNNNYYANKLKVELSIDFIDIDEILSSQNQQQKEVIPTKAGANVGAGPSPSSVEVVTSTLDKLKSQRQAQQRLQGLHAKSSNDDAIVINDKEDTDMDTADQPASSIVPDVSGILTVNIQSLIYLSESVSNSLLYITSTTTQRPTPTTSTTTSSSSSSTSSSTHLAPVYRIPPVGNTAAFDTHLHLNIHSKDLLDRKTWPPGADGPMLLLNVWSRTITGSSDDDMNKDTNNCNAGVAVPLPTDALVGCAPADLHPVLMQHKNMDTDKMMTMMMEETVPIVNYMQQVVGHIRTGIEIDQHVAEVYYKHHHQDTGGGDVHMKDDDDDEIKEEVVKAAMKADSKEKNHSIEDDNAGDIEGGGAQNRNNKQEDEKVRYAWSGSESDDVDGLLGVAYQGAVSPGFTDDEDGEFGRRRKKERESSSKGRGERKATTGGLIVDDWLFNIQKQPPPAMDTNEEEEEERSDDDSSIGINSEDEERHQGVKFANKLPPAILTTSSNMEGDNNNNSNSGSGSHMVVIPKYDGNAPAAVFIGVNSTMEGSRKGAVVVTRPIIHGTSAAAGNNNSAAEDWLFGIGKSDQPSSGAAAAASRPASGYVDQFSPFGSAAAATTATTTNNNNNDNNNSSWPSSASALDTTENSLRALTLDEVIENLKTQRQG